jgi:hypothetical protein
MFQKKSCRENQNTHFIFSNLFSKIVPFMRQRGKNSGSAEEATDENMEHELYMPDT